MHSYIVFPGLVEKGLGQTRVASVGFVLSCSGSSILLCGKDEKVTLLIGGGWHQIHIYILQKSPSVIMLMFNTKVF